MVGLEQQSIAKYSHLCFQLTLISLHRPILCKPDRFCNDRQLLPSSSPAFLQKLWVAEAASL
jgi:hypothetical protein